MLVALAVFIGPTRLIDNVRVTAEESVPCSEPSCAAKIHRATVTHVDIGYEGSLSLDEDLLEAAGLRPFERIEVWNVTNGKRSSDLPHPGRERARGRSASSGPPATRSRSATSSSSPPTATWTGPRSERFAPRVVLMDEGNRIAGIKWSPRGTPVRRGPGNKP